MSADCSKGSEGLENAAAKGIGGVKSSLVRAVLVEELFRSQDVNELPKLKALLRGP